MATLSLRELIGTLASDLVSAEAYAAQASIEFLRAIGFIRGRKAGDDWGTIRFVYFSFPTTGPDGQRLVRRLRVPLLSLLPVPLQQVAQAEYDLFVRVADVIPRKARDIGREGEPALALQTVDLEVEVAPYLTDHESIDTMPRLRLKLTLRQSDLPAGLASGLRRVEETSGEAP